MSFGAFLILFMVALVDGRSHRTSKCPLSKSPMFIQVQSLQSHTSSRAAQRRSNATELLAKALALVKSGVTPETKALLEGIGPYLENITSAIHQDHDLDNASMQSWFNRQDFDNFFSLGEALNVLMNSATEENRSFANMRAAHHDCRTDEYEVCKNTCTAPEPPECANVNSTQLALHIAHNDLRNHFRMGFNESSEHLQQDFREEGNSLAYAYVNASVAYEEAVSVCSNASDLCAKDAVDCTKKKEDCDTEQRSVERSACSYENLVETGCSTYSAKLQSLSRQYWEDANRTLLKIADRKVEYTSVVKVKCILSNLTATAHGVTANASENISQCHNRSVPVDWLTITMNSVPAMHKFCSVRPPRPCDYSYLAQYDDLPEPIKSQVKQACTSCPGIDTNTSTPPTAAPAPTEPTPAPRATKSFTWTVSSVGERAGDGDANDLEWKGQGKCWGNGARGSRAITLGESLKWIVRGRGELIGGLCLSTYTSGYKDIKYGLSATGSKYNMGIYIIESGSYVNDPSPSYKDGRMWEVYADGDELEVRLIKNRVQYVHNGTVVHTSAVSPTDLGSLYPCASFCSTGDTTTEVSVANPALRTVSTSPTTPPTPTASPEVTKSCRHQTFVDTNNLNRMIGGTYCVDSTLARARHDGTICDQACLDGCTSWTSAGGGFTQSIEKCPPARCPSSHPNSYYNNRACCSAPPRSSMYCGADFVWCDATNGSAPDPNFTCESYQD